MSVLPTQTTIYDTVEVTGVRRRSDIAHRLGDRRVAAAVSLLPDLPQQPPAAQAGIGRHALAEIGDVRVDQPRPRLTRAIDRRLQAAGDVLADRLAVDARLARDRRDRQALLMQFQDHDDIPQRDHRRRSFLVKEPASAMSRPPDLSRGAPRE